MPLLVLVDVFDCRLSSFSTAHMGTLFIWRELHALWLLLLRILLECVVSFKDVSDFLCYCVDPLKMRIFSTQI